MNAMTAHPIDASASAQIELEQRADRVANLGVILADLMDEEQLAVSQPGGLAATSATYGQMVLKKQQLLLDYQGSVKQLMSAGRDALKGLTPARRAQLKTAGLRLEAAAAASAEHLALAANATGRVLQVIMDSVRREANAHITPGYQPNQFAFYRNQHAPQTNPALIAEKA